MSHLHIPDGVLPVLLWAPGLGLVPLGPLEYHLSLLGPVGVLLGPAATFQVVFVANAVLALVGHGGLTVVGLNALVLGSGGALARPVYRLLGRRFGPPVSMAGAAAVAQAVSGALWLVVVGLGLRSGAVGTARTGLFAGVAFPMWFIGILIESVVAFGVARFLARVRPDLLPGGARPAGGER